MSIILSLKKGLAFMKTLLIAGLFFGLVCDVIAQPIIITPSVTRVSFNDDTSKIQFAIISDIWGGRRPGIFEDAINKLHLLQPQFVISVGDLIDGKSYDQMEINRQWDDFDSAIKTLNMPFYYVPGNHDISNSVMEYEWRKRLGSPYYHFIYKNVLFLVINTEDGGHGGVKDGQVNYFRKVLESNPDVRWIFLFMHRPVWQGKGDRQEGYEKIEKLLAGRRYSLFSGHHHTYLALDKNGNKHFVLGSTGGGSDLRGEKFGEFDHVTLVTLTQGEPYIVNLKLDGIIKEDVVNEKTHFITETLIDEKWMKAIPKVCNDRVVKMVKAQILFQNPTPYPLAISGKLKGMQYKLYPDSIGLTLDPGTHYNQEITIAGIHNKMLDLSKLHCVNIALQGTYNYQNTSYSLSASKDFLLSWKIPVFPTTQKTDLGSIDGDNRSVITIDQPEFLAGPWYWSGPDDCQLKFQVTQDGTHLFVHALVKDDQWINDDKNNQDALFLHLEDAHGKQQFIEFVTGQKAPEILGAGDICQENLSVNASKNENDNLWAVDFKIKLTAILKEDNSVRINIGYRDLDNSPEKQTSTLFWKPLWQSNEDYKDSGVFIIKKFEERKSK